MECRSIPHDAGGGNHGTENSVYWPERDKKWETIESAS